MLLAGFPNLCDSLCIFVHFCEPMFHPKIIEKRCQTKNSLSVPKSGETLQRPSPRKGFLTRISAMPLTCAGCHSSNSIPQDIKRSHPGSCRPGCSAGRRRLRQPCLCCFCRAFLRIVRRTTLSPLNDCSKAWCTIVETGGKGGMCYWKCY